MKKCLAILTVVTATACALYAQTPQAQQPAPNDVTVERIVAATSVENREPVGETAVFPKETARVYIWTKIAAATAPVKIKHVYYYEGKKVAEVELAVNSSPYRVWSNKSVRPGSWKVEVTDEAGTVLTTLEFSVTSEDNIPAKP
jgi:hypothetical protein